MARKIAFLASAAPAARSAPPHASARDEGDPPDDDDDDDGPDAAPGPRGTGARARRARAAASAAASAASSGSLDVPAARMKRLTERQLRGIGASTAVDAAGRPAGARLSGVSALGLGLADGDVVTSVDGQPTPTGDAATAAALGAWGSGRPVVRGTVLRGGQPIAVTVHVPPKE